MGSERRNWHATLRMNKKKCTLLKNRWRRGKNDGQKRNVSRTSSEDGGLCKLRRQHAAIDGDEM